MDLVEFHNGLRILINLDLHDLKAEGLFTEPGKNSADNWHSFRDNPWRYFIKASDNEVNRIWLAMQKRMTPASPGGGRMDLPEVSDA